ncbi:hypothetical protein RI129_002336 [Pyrocoelia pectoralis]|uniref:Prostaglandin reductase 1 n=1 Tax=Pyrocoelia pectoralis TaxID=417401 RepID=A0AAN7VNM1_9COLE
MVVAKKYILKKQFSGFPKATDVQIVEEEIRPLNDGEFLAEAVYLSVDPYMRLFEQPIGQVLMGSQVAKIIESKLEGYPVGKYVVGHFGWRTHTISKELNIPNQILPNFANMPLSLALGALGLTGNTAYFGILEICKPQKGETVVISLAGGAVGSHAGQIAKILGCKVIGILGDDEKGKYITEELGFDHFINYKKSNLKEELKKLAPNGIDCYFDNVGGQMSNTVVSLMNRLGRSAVGGFISLYNTATSDAQRVPVLPLEDCIVLKQLRIEGFVIQTWYSRWNEAIEQNLKWIQEGKLKYRETIVEGFENVMDAFLDMLKGKTIGKTIVKI